MTTMKNALGTFHFHPEISLSTAKLVRDSVTAQWFNPKDGQQLRTVTDCQEFMPGDWSLILQVDEKPEKKRERNRLGKEKLAALTQGIGEVADAFKMISDQALLTTDEFRNLPKTIGESNEYIRKALEEQKRRDRRRA